MVTIRTLFISLGTIVSGHSRPRYLLPGRLSLFPTSPYVSDSRDVVNSSFPHLLLYGTGERGSEDGYGGIPISVDLRCLILSDPLRQVLPVGDTVSLTVCYLEPLPVSFLFVV